MGRSPIRQHNHRLVLDELRSRESTSRADLIAATGLSRSTVAGIVSELVRNGEVAECDLGDSSVGLVGRRPRGLKITADAGLVGGLDYGHSHVRAALATTSGAVVAEAFGELDTNASPEAALLTGSEMIKHLVGEGSRPVADLLGVGVGLPSPVHPVSGTVSDNNILPNWVNADPAQILHDHLGVPIHLDNDANLGALAELHAGGDPHASLIYVKASSGIGAGLIFNGDIYRGGTGTAGEIGHVHVSSEQGICRCGSRGCLETVVSLPRVISDLQPIHAGLRNATDLLEVLAQNDPAATRVVGDAGTVIGRTLAVLCNVLAPDTVIIGGELGAAGEAFIGPLRQVLERHTQPMVTQNLTVRRSTHDARSELLGALQLAARHVRR